MGKTKKKTSKGVPVEGAVSSDEDGKPSSSPGSESECEETGKAKGRGREKPNKDKDEMRQLMKQLRKDIQRDMKGVIAPLEQTLMEVKANISKIQETADAAFELAQNLQTKNELLERQVQQLTDKLTEQENRGRRYNIRLRHFKEAETGEEDLKQIILNWIQGLCPDLEITPKDLDIAHRVGRRSKNWRRDILVKFVSFTIKTDVFRALKKLQELTYEGEKVQLFQDLAAETIYKRGQWKSYTQALRERKIIYKLAYPFGLSVMRGES